MPAAHTTDAEIVATLKALKTKNHGVHPETRARHLRLAKERGLTAESVVRDPLQNAEAKLRQLRAELAAIHRANDTAEEIRKTIYGLAEYSPEPPTWITDARFSGTPGIPMTIWSDWHYGERVRKDEMHGLNEFNIEIAKKRIQRLVDRTIRLIHGFAFKEAGKDVKFPGIIVCLGGDLITGDIHEELADTNEARPLECINDLLDLIAGAIEKLADHFGFVFVPCVPGNHGRTTRKPRAKNRIFTSYEWNLYTNLERHFRNDSRVQFYIPAECDAHFTVVGHRFLLTHGDSLGTKGGDGMIGSIGPIQRGNIKIGRAEAQVGQDYDTLVIGHWHSYQPKGALFPAIVNGALKGYDEYARLILRVPFDRPAQAVWFVHPQQGVTTQFPVYVDDVPKPRKKAPFVIYGAQ